MSVGWPEWGVAFAGAAASLGEQLTPGNGAGAGALEQEQLCLSQCRAAGVSKGRINPFTSGSV